MYVKITPPTTKTINNGGSCEDFVDYLKKENGLNVSEEYFFNQTGNRFSDDTVVMNIDQNALGKGGKKEDAKFFALYINPSYEELQHIQNDSDKLKEYTRYVMEQYAEGFNKDITSNDLVWYAKVEHNRYYSGKSVEVLHNEKWNAICSDIEAYRKNNYTDEILLLEEKLKEMKGYYVQDKYGKQTLVPIGETQPSDTVMIKRGMKKNGDYNKHIHVIVSRYHKEQRISYSPMANSTSHVQEINGHVAKIGFNRNQFAVQSERIFDLKFQYNRTNKNSVQYKLLNANSYKQQQQYISILDQKLNDVSTNYKINRYEFENSKPILDEHIAKHKESVDLMLKEKEYLGFGLEELLDRKKDYMETKSKKEIVKKEISEKKEYIESIKSKIGSLKQEKDHIKAKVSEFKLNNEAIELKIAGIRDNIDNIKKMNEQLQNKMYLEPNSYTIRKDFFDNKKQIDSFYGELKPLFAELKRSNQEDLKPLFDKLKCSNKELKSLSEEVKRVYKEELKPLFGELKSINEDHRINYENYNNSSQAFKNEKEAFATSKQAMQDAKLSLQATKAIYYDKKSALYASSQDINGLRALKKIEERKLYNYGNFVSTLMNKAINRTAGNIGIHQLNYAVNRDIMHGDVHQAVDKILSNYEIKNFIIDKMNIATDFSKTIDIIAASVQPQKIVLKALETVAKKSIGASLHL